MVTREQILALKTGDYFYDINNVRRRFSRHVMEGCFYSFSGPLRSYDFVGRITQKKRPFVSKRVKQFAYSTGGRTEEHNYETNDCTVRALAVVCSVSYAEAHAFMSAKGRKAKKGAVSQRIYPGASLGGYTLERRPDVLSLPEKTGNFTVGWWLKSGRLPKRCILQVKRHVFAVTDGIVVDEFKVGTARKVYGIYEAVRKDA